MSRITARYVYTNAKDEPRIKKLRWEPGWSGRGKDFVIRSWVEGAGGKSYWLRGIQPERRAFSKRALYRLPEVVAALRFDVPVWWCEGEKDSDSLAGLGFATTSTYQGAASLHRGQAEWFTKYDTASEVMVILDNDLAGGFFGWLRYRTLLDVGVDAERIRLLAPPRRFKDITELLDAGRSPSVLRTVDLGAVRRAADRYAARSASNRAPYGDWVTVTPEEIEQLKHWEPEVVPRRRR